jgi:hypothetical protein
METDDFNHPEVHVTMRTVFNVMTASRTPTAEEAGADSGGTGK